MIQEMQDGTEPVAEDELLYRRIPVSKGWYDEKGLSPEAFYPRPDEESGISVSRAKYVSVEKAGQGKSKKGYWVAVLRAGDLRQHGIRVGRARCQVTLHAANCPILPTPSCLI
jgi:hypothetical protein